MMRLLLFIKHHMRFLWSIAEWGNGIVFKIFFRRIVCKNIQSACKKFSNGDVVCRPLAEGDLLMLSAFFKSQPEESYLYFKPHGFEIADLRKVYKNPAFVMLGVMDAQQQKLLGYFMMRFFANRKCFVGFLVDAAARGRGIAGLMGKIMLTACWESNFEALATVSKKNEAALKAYRKLNHFSILKELPDDYIYIKYERE